MIQKVKSRIYKDISILTQYISSELVSYTFIITLLHTLLGVQYNQMQKGTTLSLVYFISIIL